MNTSEIIIRDDHQFPEGALVVDGYDDNGNLLAHPLGGGFQLIIPRHDQPRFHAVPDSEKVRVFRRASFALEGCDSAFAGWTDGRNWNGWAMPRFEFAEAQLLIAALGKGIGEYDQVADAFITIMDPDEQDLWPAELIDLSDRGTAKVYSVGAGSWTWEEVP